LINAVTSAERAQAEAAARDQARHAVEDYCAVQPQSGAGIRICSNPIQ